MPEIPTSHEGQDFIAPDDSQRVEDPVQAEYMARGSHADRSAAAHRRQRQSDPRVMENPSLMSELQSDEATYDRMAEATEDARKVGFEKHGDISGEINKGSSPRVSVLTSRPWLRNMPREAWPPDAREEAEQEGI